MQAAVVESKAAAAKIVVTRLDTGMEQSFQFNG